MFISARKAIEEKWITGIRDEKQMQPNAVDITADRLFKLNNQNVFTFSSEGKTHRNRTEITNPDVWTLEPGVYDVVSDCYVKMTQGIAGYLITRSTLNRNGVFIQSGLYDSGYKGPVQCILYNLFGITVLEPGLAVAQFVFVDAPSGHTYAGGYNTEEGQLPDYISDPANITKEPWMRKP